MHFVPLAVLALATGQLGSAPAPKVSVDAVDAAIDGPDRQTALDLAYQLAEQRQGGDGSNQTDPELAYLFGRLHLRGGRPGSAIAYLRRADVDALPPRRRASVLIALADAYEAAGDRPAARAAVGRLDDTALTERQQGAAALWRARLALADDPATALALVTPLLRTDAPSDRFEALMLTAQAHGLAGDRAAARQAAEQAWSAALAVPPGDHAAVQAGLLLAAIGGGSEASAGLLHTISGGTLLPAGNLLQALPVCGERGLRPDDEATFVAFVDGDGNNSLMPVAATRPAAAAALLDALAGRDVVADTVIVGRGTVLSVRCRMHIGAVAAGPMGQADPIDDLLAARNIYVAYGHDWDADRVLQLEERISALGARHGRTHPLLIAPLLELNDRTVWRMERQGALAEIADFDLRRRVNELLRALPEAAEYVPTPEEEAQSAAMGHMPPDRYMQAGRLLVERMVARIGLQDAYLYATGWLDDDREMGAPQRQRIIEALLPRFESMPGDPRRRALLLRLARVQFEQGNHEAARANVRAAGVPVDACSALPEAPVAAEGSIGGEAYPSTALRYGITGVTVLEHSVTREGSAADVRILVASPPGLFDEIARNGVARFRFSPPRRDGRPVVCTGRVQRVQWSLPGDGEPSHPSPQMMPAPFDT